MIVDEEERERDPTKFKFKIHLWDAIVREKKGERDRGSTQEAIVDM